MEYYVDLELICSAVHNLAFKIWKRFEQSKEREELQESIFLGRIALGLYPDLHPDRNEVLINLGGFLYTRFEEYGVIEDLEEAIERCRAALELCPCGHPNRLTPLINLAHSLHTRSRQHGRTIDLDEAIEHYRTALRVCPSGHSGRSLSLNGLAGCLQFRYELHGQTTDIDEAIKYHRAALELFPHGHPDRCEFLNGLAISLQTRFQRQGRAADLDEAIDHHRTALDIEPCHHDHLTRSSFLHNLAGSLTIRFQQNGETADIDEAIGHYRAALDSQPDGHPNRSVCLDSLASSLSVRFEQHGQLADLDEAIECHRAALELQPRRHFNRSLVLDNLAISLRTRFEQHGRIADLEEAIVHHRATLELLPNNHFHRSGCLGNLALSLKTRFHQYGQTADIDEAIEHHRAALGLRQNGHPNRSSSLNNLAISLQTRFNECRRQIADLNEAVELCYSALELCPNGHPDRSMVLNSLAGSLKSRFEQHRQTADLDEAIVHYHAALELYPSNHPDRWNPLNNLANSLRTRFYLYGQTIDLDEAIQLHRTALELRPEGHPSHSMSLRDLGFSLLARFEKFGLADSFEECMKLLERATVHDFSSLTMRLEIARLWADLAQRHSHCTTSRAYKMAMPLLQHVLIVSPSLHAQHEFLRHHSMTFGVNGVAYAIEGNRLEEAVEMLEQGRGLLWSQMRGFRTPLDCLEKVNSELANSFRDVSRQLESLATSSSTVLQSLSSTVVTRSSVLNAHSEGKLYEEQLKLKIQLSTKQEGVINEIRKIPGFTSFLAATSFHVLQCAASEGPVIVVNHSKHRSDVLIILSREDRPVVCIPLDREFYEEGIELCAKLVGTRSQYGPNSAEYDGMLRCTLKTLWDRVVSKVVDKLDELGISEGSRIWWCPTSWLSALPFHAAGPFKDTDGTMKYLLDKYISSYTPTLEALINSRSCGNGEEPTTLVIVDTSLPSAKDEIRKIKNCGMQTKLLNSKESHDVVIKALRKATWVHFICHGRLDSKPFNSSFKVSDRRLTLLDIVQANLPHAEFAFLSACHTAGQSFEVAPDEALHLAAAMQFSGFRSVIGSMWELLDGDGPFFARTVYEYMCNCDEGEAKYKRAATGLREAAIQLKARDDIRTERWVNLIHIGA
ncbi:uncharacterized protein FOMMEDRAFT_161001 [Fomitiporia mediterranea MF3/22]|uniref:uncharacterized protein n=1 Tax=Fomitiporia mediterranea (strain MF3/22) TaxID=694068 RepID=UPI0004407361|nr:uncharacterized protein FOMMEDRAFT_161001 [Fomitiporia mediterranea MF3/22]EJC99388.1 hypothetical protein FOMMEDRAFT_161001 [Fomitiporia mediterranea MF3/22]